MKNRIIRISFIIDSINNILNFCGIWVIAFTFPILQIIAKQSENYRTQGTSFFLEFMILLLMIFIIYNNFYLYIGGCREFHPFTFLKWIKQKITNTRNLTLRDLWLQNPRPPKDMILNNREGFILGKQGRYKIGIPLKGDAIYGMIHGKPGTGKSSAISIPNVSTWKYPAVVCDPKNEIWRKGHVERKNLYIINPLLGTEDPRFTGFDPLDFVQYFDNAVEGLKSITLSLLPTSEKDVFWRPSAQNYALAGLIYYHLDKGLGFSDCCQKIYSTSAKSVISQIMKDGSREAKVAAGGFVGLADNTFSGIVLDVYNSISCFVFDKGIINLLNTKKRIRPTILTKDKGQIYLAIPEYKLDSCKAFVSIFFDTILKWFSIQDERQATHVLFILDEFSKYNVPSVATSMALLRSRKVSIVTIQQGLSQLKNIYGENVVSNMKNCLDFSLLLGINDLKDAENFSKEIGTYEKKQKNKMETISNVALVKPEELRNTKKVYAIMSNPTFLQFDKAFYFNDKDRKISD